MKQIVFYLFIFFLFAQSTHSQKKKTVLQNNLKSVVVYEQSNVSKTDKGVKIEETIFDLNGNIIDEFEYENGKESSHVKYEYDDAEKKIKESKLNAQGRVIKSTLFEYNDEDLRVKEIESDGSGKIVKIIEYSYDGDLKASRIVSDGTKTVKSKRSYEYTTH